MMVERLLRSGEHSVIVDSWQTWLPALDSYGIFVGVKA